MSRTQTPLPAHDDVGAGRGSDEVSGPSLGSSVPGEVVSGPLTSMTDQQAAWVRATVWTPDMRRGLTGPSIQRCACQIQVTTWACRNSQHDLCELDQHPDYETTIWSHGGLRPAVFPTTNRHKTRADGGYRRRADALVWLADRVCRWACPCECRHPAAAAKPVQAGAEPVQLDLFAAVRT